MTKAKLKKGGFVESFLEKWRALVTLVKMQLKEKMVWGVWLCGHFHDDRILAPHAEMLSLGIKNLDDIMEYWK